MNILLTGANGFVASHLIPRLASLFPDDNYLFLFSSASSLHEFAQSSPHLQSRSILTTTNEFLNDPKCFPAPDVALLLGAFSANKPYSTLEKCVYENSMSQLNLVETISPLVSKLIVTFGTYFEYGLSANHFEFIPVDAPLLPIDPYSTSKALFFNNLFYQLVSGQISSRASFLHLRLSQIYGEGEPSSRLVPTVLDHARNNKPLHLPPLLSIRDFTSVSYVVDQVCSSLLINSVATLEVRNITRGQPVIIRDFLTQIWTEENTKAELTFDDPDDYAPLLPHRFVPMQHTLPVIM